MLLAAGPGVPSLQDYTKTTEAKKTRVQSQQGDTLDTLYAEYRDVTNSGTIAAEDDLVWLDERDLNGWPTLNLLANPSFEGTYSGGYAPSWGPFNSFTSGTVTPTAGTTGAIFGSEAQSVQISNIDNTAHNAVTTVGQQFLLPTDEFQHPIIALPYCASIWYFVTAAFSGATVSLNIEYWTKSGGTFLGGNSVVINTGGISDAWQRATVTATPPAGAALVKFIVYFTETSATNSGTMLLDGAQLEYCTFANFQSTAFLPQLRNTGLTTGLGMLSHRPQPVTPLTLYGSGTATSTLATADGLQTTSSDTTVATNTTLIGTATGYGEVYSQGNAGAWAAGSGLGNPSGHGLLWDVTTLEGDHFAGPNNWSQTVKLAVSVGQVTANIIGRWWLYNALTNAYTAIGSSSLTAQPITTTANVFTLPGVSIPKTPVPTGSKLYVDLWLDITTNSTGSGTATVNWTDLSTTANTGGSSNATTTPGYRTKTVVDGWFDSAVLNGMVFYTDSQFSQFVQAIDFYNVVSPPNIFTANQSDVETDTSGFNWFVGSTGTVTRDATTAWHGSSSLKVVTDATATFEYVNAQVQSNQLFASQFVTVSFYIKAPAAGGTLRYFVDSDQGSVSAVNTLTLSTTWTRYTITFTVPNPITQQWFAWRVDTGSPAQALTFNVDGLQFEIASSASTWQLGVGQDQNAFTRGIAQDKIPWNPNSTYTISMTYRITVALTAPAQASIGINYLDGNGNGLLNDHASALGPPGEGVSSVWKTLSIRVGPGTPNLAPQGTVLFKIFCGLECQTSAPISGQIVITSISMIPDPPAKQANQPSYNALTAGMYPSIYCDSTQPGCYVDTGRSGLAYRQLRYFGGFIKTFDRDYSASPERQYKLSATEYGIILQEAPATLTIVQQTDVAAITAAVNYAQQQGFLVGLDAVTFVQGIASIDQQSFSMNTTKDVLNYIANQTTGAYYVDYYLRLHYMPALAASAPYALSDSPDLISTFPYTDFIYTQDSTQTATEPVIEGGSQVSAPQTFTGSGADATLSAALNNGTQYSALTVNAIGVAVPQGSILTINYGGGTTQQVTTSGAAAVGATSIPCIQFTAGSTFAVNTKVAIGTTFSINGGAAISLVDSCTAAGVAQTVGLQSNDTLGSNGITALYSPNQGSVQLWVAIGSTQTISVVYRFDAPVIVRLHQSSAESPTGVVRRKIFVHTKHQTIRSKGSAIDRAKGDLGTSGKPRPMVTLRVWSPPAPGAQPLHVGQAVALTHAVEGFSQTLFQIQTITVTTNGNDIVLFDLGLGFYRPDLIILLAQSARQSSNTGSDNNSAVQLQDVLSVSDGWAMTDQLKSPTVENVGVWGGSTSSTWGGTFVWG